MVSNVSSYFTENCLFLWFCIFAFESILFVCKEVIIVVPAFFGLVYVRDGTIINYLLCYYFIIGVNIFSSKKVLNLFIKSWLEAQTSEDHLCITLQTSNFPVHPKEGM